MERTVSGFKIRKNTKRELGDSRRENLIRVILNRTRVKVSMTQGKITLRSQYLTAAQLRK